jgi:AraC-like DNA-binding protein
MNPSQFQEDFFSQINPVTGISHLFDFMPEVSFYVLNRDSQFVKANQTYLQLLGVADEKDIIGKTNRDFYDHYLADRYIEEDQKLMAAQKPVTNDIWLVPDSDGILVWHLSAKIPLFDKNGKVIGIAGTMRDYKIAGSVLEPYTEIAEVIKYINDNYHAEITIQSLAELAHLSISQFERKFKKLLNTTPLKYITKLRLNSACELLSQGNSSITKIALSVGYYDHSYFTKIFTRELGTTPKEYRKQYYEAKVD